MAEEIEGSMIEKHVCTKYTKHYTHDITFIVIKYSCSLKNTESKLSDKQCDKKDISYTQKKKTDKFLLVHKEKFMYVIVQCTQIIVWRGREALLSGTRE